MVRYVTAVCYSQTLCPELTVDVVAISGGYFQQRPQMSEHYIEIVFKVYDRCQISSDYIFSSDTLEASSQSAVVTMTTGDKVGGCHGTTSGPH